MRMPLLILMVCLLLPTGLEAAPASATFSAGRSVFLASTSPGNAYAAGASLVVTSPVGGDLTAIGGSVITTAPVAGDESVFGGSVYSRSSVSGDLRVIGGSISVDEPVQGDMIVGGISVRDVGRASGSVFIIAATVDISSGAGGPVTIYGNNIALAGNFNNDVTIVSSGRISLGENTVIAGRLSYQAPEEALIPSSATIRGGVSYHNASYLPDSGTSRALSILSIAIFLLVRILGALILAGLLAGLFPRLAELLVSTTLQMRPSRIILTTLLGFAVFVVTPVLFLLLALTFVGIGLALLCLVAYGLIALLSLIYAGIMLGSLLAHRYARRDAVLWHDGVLGMLALSIIALVPYIGVAIVFFLTMFAAGLLVLTFFHFAFPHEEETQELL